MRCFRGEPNENTGGNMEGNLLASHDGDGEQEINEGKERKTANPKCSLNHCTAQINSSNKAFHD